MARDYSILVATRCMDNLLGPFFMMPMMRRSDDLEGVKMLGMEEREREEEREEERSGMSSMSSHMSTVEVLNIAFSVNDELQVCGEEIYCILKIFI